jgi:hypothetical protein
MSTQTFPIPLQIPSYSNTQEYRQCLRSFFQMDSAEYREILQKYQDELQDDFDDETCDEMSYDEGAAKRAMDSMYLITHKHPLFQELFDHAAARMFSTDREIGLAVLCSYDYLSRFHACIVQFLQTPEQFTAESPLYRNLRKDF